MRIPVSSHPWQPLTFGGVAGLAQAPLARLLKVQGAVALLVAAGVLWFLSGTCFPQLDEAAAGLPDQCAIRNRRLEWGGASPVVLTEGPFLAITVDLERGAALAAGADLQFELGRDELRIRSLLGYLPVRYPAGWNLTLNRLEAQAWWGAWRGFLLIGVGVGAVVGLFVSWTAVAIVFGFPARTLAFYLNRHVSSWGSWKLSAAALLPAAVWMVAALGLYRFRRMDLIGLVFAWLVHWVVGWVYLVGGVWRLPRHPDTPARKGNPFG
jgi:hypothetical protein